jgi:hypothetical protein
MSYTPLFAAFFLPGLWLGLLLPIRYAWVIPVLLAGAMAYAWFAHHQAVIELLTVSVFLPIVVVAELGMTAGAITAGFVGGQAIRRSSMAVAVKTLVMLLITGAVVGVVALSTSRARAAQEASVRFHAKVEAGAQQLLARDARVLAITGLAREISLFSFGETYDSKPPFGQLTYFVSGDQGKAVARMTIGGSREAPSLTLQSVAACKPKCPLFGLPDRPRRP